MSGQHVTVSAGINRLYRYQNQGEHDVKSYLLSALTANLLAVAISAAVTIPAGAADTPAAAVAAVTTAPRASGIGTAYMDPTVRPQDDFFLNLNGKWLRDTQIPADRASWGAFDKLEDDIKPQLRGIIEAAAKDGGTSADAKRIGDFYASFMDEAKVEQLGLAPLNGELARVAALRDKKEIPALIAHFNRVGFGAPYGVGIHQDNKDSTKYVADIGQDGLGLPDRDYYLSKHADKLAKYQGHITRMLTLAGDADAAAKAQAIVALETALAKAQWDKVQLRDPVKAYNKVALDKLGKLAPGYDWASWLKDSGVAGKVDYVIVGQPSYVSGFNALLGKTPLATWQAYFKWHALHAAAPYLSKAYVDEDFAFYGSTLREVSEMQPRWKRGVAATEGALGESIGKLYVEQYFPAERKARMDALVHNLLAAYNDSIATLDWMTPATKEQAQAKLAKFTTKIGYPIDRDEWGMTPQTVNAYYNPEMNEIVFPAAILQPPFFDADADDAA